MQRRIEWNCALAYFLKIDGEAYCSRRGIDVIWFVDCSLSSNFWAVLMDLQLKVVTYDPRKQKL